MADMNKRVVLLIEDNEDHADIVRFHIAEHAPDIEVKWIDDGEKAIGYFSDQSMSLPWLVLLDIKLPKYDGHEVLTHIRVNENLKSIPVVIFTTSSAYKDIETAFGHGANSYILKPMEAGEFSAVIAKIIDYWSLNQQAKKIDRLHADA